MKLKQLAVLLTASLLTGLNLTAQNLENFETEAPNSTSFVSATQVFNITTQLSGAQPFDMQTGYPNTGWSGTANDNVYVDNSGGTVFGQGVGFTISSAGSVPFRVNSVWLYLSDRNLINSVSGSLTIVGKLAGATQFTATANSGFNTGVAANGFSLIDFTTFGGSNNTGLSIDQLVITTTASYEYVALDAFNWSTVSCTAPTITANPPNRAICAGNNTTFSASASGATAFQWQVNTGSGFTNITNGGVYSGATTNILTLTGVTAGMTGNQYRMVAINGVASCFTNTNAGTLTVSSVNTSSASQTNVSCFNGSNGAASVSPSGGIAPYSYSWSPSGGTGSIATGLTAGSYTVIVTDIIGCQGTRNYTITQPPNLAGSTVVTNVACNGGNNGAINLTPSGGAPGYTFNWGGGVTTEDRTSLAAGTYAVIITDANGCTRNVTGITLTQPTAAVSGTTVVTNVACFGGNTGAINLTPTGGTGPYTYNWLPSGPFTEDRVSLVAGTYSVQITDINGCTGTVSPTVTQPTSAVSGTTVVTNVACFGGNTGAINLTPTGGTGPYTYNWLPSGPATEDRTSLVAGTYQVQITDINGCTGTVSPTVTQPTSAVSGTTVVTNVACFGGNTGAINLTPTGGTGPYTYNWLPSGPTTEDRTSLVAGTYQVQITDVNGCTGTVNPTVTQPTSAVSGTTVVTNVACFGGNTGAINLTPTGGTGPYTFVWTAGPTTEDRTSLVAGTYQVQITDVNGCTGTVNPTVTQPTSAVSGTTVVTNVACFGGNTGAINLTPTGGTGPYTFVWTAGPTTEDRTSLVAGTYQVQITDINGCTGTVSPTVTQPTAAVSGTTVVTNVACFGGNTGAINLTPTGGTGPYTYNWLPSGPTTEDRTGLVAGTYQVQITDLNGCTGTVTATVTQPTSPVSGATVVTNVSCFGGSNGAINLTPTGGTGPYTYNWLPSGPTTEDRTGLVAGTYQVQITDLNGCTGTVTATVTQPTSAVSGTTVVTNVSCFGGSNGTINLTPNGGAGSGYTFNWGGGITTEDRTGLAAGTYSVIITDANGCAGPVSGITVTQPTPISFTAASQTNVACFGGSNGDFSVNPALGGAGSFTYDWNPGTPTGDGTTFVSGLTAQAYSVTATDQNGCTATISFTITEPTPISFTAASQTNVSCFGGSNGAFAMNAAIGGAGGFTYDWAPGTPTGDGTTSVTGLTAGTYTVTATDANGCTATQGFTITEPGAISLTASAQTNVACNGGSTGAASVNAATGGMGGFTYDWTPGTPTGDGTTSITGLAAGTYTVTATDANGCTATQTFTVTQPALITSSITVTDCDSYTLNGQTYFVSGVYSQDLVAVNGCDSVVTLNLTINNSTSSTTTATACDSYEWTDGTTYTVSGTYTQDLTNSVGCDSTATLVLTINNATSSTLTETACYSYTFNGTVYNATGVYTQILTNAAGCDSTATLVLTINNATSSTTTITACDSYEWTNGTTYTVSGTYTQDLTNSAGCDSTATLVLTINNATSSTLTETACDSYTLNGTTYTASGMYMQSLTNAAGCDSTITLSLTINTSPTAGISQTSDVELQASGTGTYQWINCADDMPIQGETNAAFTATQNGSYAVVVSNGSCSDTSNCILVDNVGLSELNTVSFALAPNPTQDLFRVFMSGTPEATVVIFDNQGKVVQTLEHVTSETVISLANVDRGMYLVQISAKNGTHTERIIKQ